VIGEDGGERIAAEVMQDAGGHDDVGRFAEREGIGTDEAANTDHQRRRVVTFFRHDDPRLLRAGCGSERDL